MGDDSSVTLRTRKVIQNALLRRRQMIIDVIHPNRCNLSTTELRRKLSELYQVPQNRISVFGLRTHYAGGKSTGFALIYDSRSALKKFEPSYRLVRLKEAVKVIRQNRQIRSHFKNWADRYRGRMRSFYRVRAGRGPKKTVPWNRERELEELEI